MNYCDWKEKKQQCSIPPPEGLCFFPPLGRTSSEEAKLAQKVSEPRAFLFIPLPYVNTDVWGLLARCLNGIFLFTLGNQLSILVLYDKALSL